MEKTKTKKKKTIFRIIFFALLIALAIWTIWANTAVQLNTVTVTSKNLPQSFDGYKIALVSDLHDAEIGDNNETLIELLKQASPDIIAITGDLIDCHRLDIENSLNFVKQANEIAPCYYVAGNHEGLIDADEYERLKSGLVELGVTVLNDEEEVVERNGEKISLVGITDPMASEDEIGIARKPDAIRALSSYDFTILLSHRPELFYKYEQAGVDLSLCGHAHGGQFRLPFIGGLYGPNQGLFPEYDSGLYTKNSSNMVVSRGIGNSGFPLRFNNRPEIVLVELKAEN